MKKLMHMDENLTNLLNKFFPVKNYQIFKYYFLSTELYFSKRKIFGIKISNSLFWYGI